MRRLIPNVLLGASILLGGQALAQETLVWQFEKGPNPNDAAKRPQASVRFHVPETDIFQAGATCSAYDNPGFSKFFFVADVSSLQAGKDVKLRFSGNGREVEVDGKVRLPDNEEASPGVDVQLPNDSPLWQAFANSSQLSYGVPGFGFNALQLTGGQSSLNSFVTACREFAGGAAQPVAGSNGDANDQSGLSEKEAFGFARDIDTAASYRAFLQRYPSGFFADLAQAALSKLDGSAPAPGTPPVNGEPPSAPPPPAPAELAQLNAGPEQGPWVGFDHQETDTSPSFPAAGVEMGGTALIAYCQPDLTLRFAMRKQDGGPADALNQHILQAQNQVGGVNFQVDGGQQQTIPMSVDGVSNVASSPNALDPNGELANNIIRGSVLTVSGPTFNLAYQLKGSKVQMCGMFAKCGIQSAVCAPPRPAAVAPPPRRADPPRVREPRQAVPRCRSRSVFIEGRGCVLRRSLNQPPPRVREPRIREPRIREPRIREPRQVRPRCRPRSVFIEGRGCVLRRSAQPRPVRPSNGCRRGQIRFEGRCMRPGERRGFCGPGFRPQGNRCVRRGNNRAIRCARGFEPRGGRCVRRLF